MGSICFQEKSVFSREKYNTRVVLTVSDHGILTYRECYSKASLKFLQKTVHKPGVNEI